MSACAMEVEPSGTSLSVNSRLAWQQEVRSSATQSSGQSCNYAAGGPQAMHVNDTADSSVVDQAYSVALCSVEDLASAMCDEEQSESLLIVDTRSFLEYNTTRVHAAVNLCCSKLIKRRLQNDKVTIKDLLDSCCSSALPDASSRIVLYDQCTQDPKLLPPDCFLVVLLAKLAREFRNMALLRGGFVHFQARFPHLCDGMQSGNDRPLGSYLGNIMRANTFDAAPSVSSNLNNNQPTVVNQNLRAASFNADPNCSVGRTVETSEQSAAGSARLHRQHALGTRSGHLSVRVEGTETHVSPQDPRSPVSGAASEPSTPSCLSSIIPMSGFSVDDCDRNRMLVATAASFGSGGSVSDPSALKHSPHADFGPTMALAERARLLSPGTGASGAVSGPCLPVSHAGPSRIMPYLYLGSQQDAFDAEIIKANGITHVINVSATCPQTPHVRQENFLRISVNDSFYERLSGHFRKAYDFIERARAEGGCTLVHCLAGISRSPTITIAFIMRLKAVSSDDAYKLVKRARPAIAPNFNFLGQLLEYEKLLKQESACAIDSLASSPSGTTPALLSRTRSLRLNFSGNTLSASAIASPNTRSTNASTPVSETSAAQKPCDVVDKSADPSADTRVSRKVSASSLVANVTASTKLRHVETIVCHSATPHSTVTPVRAESLNDSVCETATDDHLSKRPCLPHTRSLDKCTTASSEKRGALSARRLLLAKSSCPKFDFSTINTGASQPQCQPQCQSDSDRTNELASTAPATPTSELAKLSFSSETACKQTVAVSVCAAQPQSCTSALLLEFTSSTTSSLKAVPFTKCANANGQLFKSSPCVLLSAAQQQLVRTPSPSRRQNLLMDNSNSPSQTALSESLMRRYTNERENFAVQPKVHCDARSTAHRGWTSLTNMSTNSYCAATECGNQTELGGNSNSVLLAASAAKSES